MKYVMTAIQPGFNVYVPQDRLMEFTQAFFVNPDTSQLDKNKYLYNAIMDGWVKREEPKE